MSDSVAMPACSGPLPWQQSLWAEFNRQIGEGTLPHALLLGGPQYIGKERLALALARLLLCQQPSGGTNCGCCHACEMTAAGSHGDFRWLSPDTKSRVIKVDQVRQAIDFSTRTAGFGARKVIVFSPAEAMNINAANALLKCLEEPPAGTFLILVAAQPQRLPVTVRSRCRMVRVPQPTVEQSLEWMDRLTGSREDSLRWLDVVDGRPLLAEQLYSHPDADKLIASRLACRALLAGELSSTQAVALLDELDVEQVLEQVAGTVRQSLRKLSRDALTNPATRAAFGFLDEIQGIQRAVAGGANPNRQLLYEVLLEKLQFLLGGVGRNGSIGA